MATEKVAATAKAIKAKYGKMASAEFIVKALEEEMSMDDVGESLLQELMTQMSGLETECSALKARCAAMEEQMSQMQPMQQPSMPSEEEKPAMRARGVAAIRSAPVPSIQNATQSWKEKIEKYVSQGLDQVAAVRRVNRENPGLRASMLSERGIR